MLQVPDCVIDYTLRRSEIDITYITHTGELTELGSPPGRGRAVRRRCHRRAGL